jgi:hypothetical protein
MELSNKDRELVHRSIEHWIRMRDMSPKELVYADKDDRPRATGCPLCREYVLRKGTCNGCPVSSFTGRPRCDDTPWRRASEAWVSIWQNWLCEGLRCVDTQEWIDACNAEITFLYSLLGVQELSPPRPEPTFEELIMRAIEEKYAVQVICQRGGYFIPGGVGTPNHVGPTLRRMFGTYREHAIRSEICKTHTGISEIVAANKLLWPHGHRLSITSARGDDRCMVALEVADMPEDYETRFASSIQEASHLALRWAIEIVTQIEWQDVIAAAKSDDKAMDERS